MRKRNLKTRMLIWMRHLGMLCRAPRVEKPVLRIQRTVYPDNRLTPIDSEIYIYLETKKQSYKNCKFNPLTRSCECGVILDNFGAYGCPDKNKKPGVTSGSDTTK
jgi:hypothetical protein